MRRFLLLFLLPLATCLNSSIEFAHAASSTSGQSFYDEQLILAFNQTFTDLSFNVTAVPQCGPEGIGIGYILNGLSNLGYWYQVGLSWRWPLLTNSSTYPTRPGFDANYEVFSSDGSSLRIGGKGPLLRSGPVNPGDIVLLRMRFLNGNVSLSLHDWNNNGSDETSYQAFGATSFVSAGGQPVDHHGFFTGLMTEQYHPRAYYGDERQAKYSTSGTSLSSAWMIIDEFSYPYSQYSEFAQASQVSYSDPKKMINFTLNGASESSNPNQFITGRATSGFDCPQTLFEILLERYWYVFPIIVSAAAAVIAITFLRWRKRQTAPYFQSTPPPPNTEPSMESTATEGSVALPRQ